MRKGTTALGNIEFLKWCEQARVYVDWNLLFGFPGERLEDYERTWELASLITHLKAPSSAGRIRMDRFSENFVHAEAPRLRQRAAVEAVRVRVPVRAVGTLADLVYYFDSDLRTPIDDQGYLRRIAEHVSGWKRRNDSLLARRADGSLVIHDSRPAGLARQIVLTGVRKDIYEYLRHEEDARADRGVASREPGRWRRHEEAAPADG